MSCLAFPSSRRDPDAHSKAQPAGRVIQSRELPPIPPPPHPSSMIFAEQDSDITPLSKTSLGGFEMENQSATVIAENAQRLTGGVDCPDQSQSCGDQLELAPFPGPQCSKRSSHQARNLGDEK